MSATVYPVRVQARLDRPLSRWLWLVKWLLAIPHYFVLAFLWVAFVMTTIVAFFAILFAGRYPRSLFDFNVGVLRWTWRVQYYAYGALATDQYPPFSLDDVPDYPAHFDVAYPEHLSHGLVLVKWWLLALPHYLVVAVFAGGGGWAVTHLGDNGVGWVGGGLIGLLALIAAIILAFTGRYPASVFDFVLGMNRWVLRVAAYAGLMTDEYPPFRLDMGGEEPGGPVTFVAPPQVDFTKPVERPPSAPWLLPTTDQPPRPSGPGMGAGRIVAIILSSVLVLIGLGATVGGSVLAWANASKNADGFLTTSTERFSTPTAALTSDGFTIDIDGNGWLADHLGTIRITATSSANRPVFIGIAPESDVQAWLSGKAYDQVRDLAVGPFSVRYDRQPGTFAAVAAPGAQSFWEARSRGGATQTLTWPVAEGRWTVVVANADGSPGVTVDARLGAKLPWLGPLSVGLIVGGVVLMVGGTAAIVGAVMGGRRQRI